jgi:SagB-type dehydrogenase family enzyme
MTINRQTELAWKYHDFTKHSYWSIRTNPHMLDWANMPAPFKIYPELEPIPLPTELAQSGTAAFTAIASMSREAAGGAKPDLKKLASLLYYSAGVTKKKSYPGGTIYFRASACAGALYPVETYVVCGDLEGVAAGVYHFNPGDFSLRLLRGGDYRGKLAGAAADPELSKAPFILVYSAISWRSTWKYRDRAYRYHFWDNGMILANVLAMAAAHGLPAKVLMGFVEEEVDQLIGIDGDRELALSLVAVGHAEAGDAISEDGLATIGPVSLPLSESQVDYQSITEMHGASSLASQEEVARWKEARMGDRLPEVSVEPIQLASLAAEQLPQTSIEEVIQRRASTRRFAKKAMPYEDLSVILDRSSRSIPFDFSLPAEGYLNELYLIINRVEGIAPGAYFYRKADGALELLKGGDFSERAAYLSLDQDLGGDSSFTIFFMADLKHVLEKFGNRGYRAVQMEAGIIGGRCYLSAYALGRGATGLTFYDDDVTAFFSPHAAGKSCIFVMAIGIPGKKPLY